MLTELLLGVRRQSEAATALWTFFNRLAARLLSSFRVLRLKGKRRRRFALAALQIVLVHLRSRSGQILLYPQKSKPKTKKESLLARLCHSNCPRSRPPAG